MLAGAVRRALDLGDHGGHARDIRRADDARAELCADDAEVSQLRAAWQVTRRVEQREARRRGAAAGRAVDLAVGEDRDVALHVLALALPEDDAVDVAQLRLERMDDLVARFELVLELAAPFDQARQLLRRDPLLDRRVEGAAERDIDAGDDVAAPHERRDVAEADGTHAPVLHARLRLEPARRDVDDNAGAIAEAVVERPRDESDRPVTARRRVARVVEEDDAEIRALVLRLGDEAAVHVGVPARLVDEQPAQAAEPLRRVASLLEDRPATELLAGDDSERLPRGVVVDRLDLEHSRTLADEL